MSDKRLAPWLEIQYFQTPKVTQLKVSFVGTAWAVMLQPNPNRVSLWLSSSTQFYWTTDNTQLNLVGLSTSNTQTPLVITEAEHGPLCTSAWYCYCPGGSGIAVAHEVILREFPG